MGIFSSKHSDDEPWRSLSPSHSSLHSTSHRPVKALNRQFSRIADNYQSLEQVTADLRKNGLESSNLIVGIDFTKSNEWTGSSSFNGKSLHSIGHTPNPYEQAISIIGRTLSSFDDDNLIPCFGFGDATTHDQNVFSFNPGNQPCQGFEEALSRYRELVPQVRLAGPTSFGPIIRAAIDIVEESGGQYHVLVIVADGQVTRSVDTESGVLSPQENETISAIVDASDYALSIILVGVGDGPWDMMKEFDDNIPERRFDNFQFVNFTGIMSRAIPDAQKEALFALSALMEIPSQFKATMIYGILNHSAGKERTLYPCPPPENVRRNTSTSSRYPHSGGFNSPSYQEFTSFKPGYESARGSSSGRSGAYTDSENQFCPICLTNPKDMAFGCGHQTCQECAESLSVCPICRKDIETKIRLF